MTTARKAWWVGGAALVAVAIWMMFARGQATDVDAGTVTSGALRVTIDEAGTTRVRGHADVNAPVAGRWVPAALRAGDPVRVGAVLGVLYPAPMDESAQEQARARVGAAEAAQREAETRVTAARSALEEATRTLARTERMAEAGGMSPQDVERARDDVTGRRSEFEGAQLRATAARFELSSARAVVAPFGGDRKGLPIVAAVGGTVLRVFEEHERVVAPGTPLAEVGDPRDLEVVIPLLTADAARVRDGAVVVMSFGGRADTLRGRVVRVEPSAFTKISALGVEEQRVNVIASTPATDAHIGDQYRVQARVTVWESQRALRVPVGALVRDGEHWFVFVIEGGRARRRAVTVGERGEELAEVRAGLTNGERVVLYPGNAALDGQRVARGSSPFTHLARMNVQNQPAEMPRDQTRHHTEALLLQLQQVVEASLNAVALADVRGVITYVNPAFLRVWGYDRADEVIGRHASSFWESSAAADAIIAHLLSAREPWVGELAGIRRSGSNSWPRCRRRSCATRGASRRA